MNVPSITPNLFANSNSEKLVANKALSPDEKLEQAARQFEAIFIRQMLKEMHKPLFKSEFIPDSAASDTYRDMMNGHLADAISNSGGFGLARQLKVQLQKQLLTPETNSESTTKPMQNDKSQDVSSHD